MGGIVTKRGMYDLSASPTSFSKLKIGDSFVLFDPSRSNQLGSKVNLSDTLYKSSSSKALRSSGTSKVLNPSTRVILVTGMNR